MLFNTLLYVLVFLLGGLFSSVVLHRRAKKKPAPCRRYNDHPCLIRHDVPDYAMFDTPAFLRKQAD